MNGFGVCPVAFVLRPSAVVMNRLCVNLMSDTAVGTSEITLILWCNRNRSTPGWAGGITEDYSDPSPASCTSFSSSPASSFCPSIYIQPPMTNSTGSPIGIAGTAGASEIEKNGPKGIRILFNPYSGDQEILHA